MLIKRHRKSKGEKDFIRGIKKTQELSKQLDDLIFILDNGYSMEVKFVKVDIIFLSDKNI